MKSILKRSSVLLPAVALILTATLFAKPCCAQTKLELSIGDAAPPLAYSKWIKGTPLKSLSGDKIYVLEFWATWCKPCIAAMPHLSELAEKYADKISVIAVNISERTGGKPYESSLPAVTAFVEQNAEIMKFNVIADNNAKYMSDNYLKKGNINGIPATMLVKDNRILWIGHPTFLDGVLKEIFDGTYNLEERKRVYEKDMLKSMASRNTYLLGLSRIDSAVARKDFNGAIKLAEQSMISEPANVFAYRLKKMQVLLAYFDVKAVGNYLNETGAANKEQALALANYIGSQENVSEQLYSVAIASMQKAETKNTFYLDRLACFQSRVGDFKDAAVTQERALILLRELALKSPGEISPDVVKEFETKVETHKSGKPVSSSR